MRRSGKNQLAIPAVPATLPAGETDPRWLAVLRRDRACDGEFVYSVKSTGVYCRPSCGARLPRRENVEFHATSEAAGQAGFRPCKRCRPDESNSYRKVADLVTRACRLIESAEESPSLQTLAAAVGLSPFYFHRAFRQITGLTPRAWAAAQRAERIRRKLPRSRSVTEAIYQAGFNSSSRFYEKSSGMLGMTPAACRTGARGLPIQFAIAECSLGSILVAATGQGLCAILLGADPGQLARDLQDRFPKASLHPGDAAFHRLVARVIAFVEEPQTGLELPLDLRGTAFQQRVWQALREIPPGATLTYTELARRIGRPAAVRAVATACAANPLAIAVPCHRVIRTDGTLSGYRWGVDRKRALLNREALQKSRARRSQPPSARGATKAPQSITEAR